LPDFPSASRVRPNDKLPVFVFAKKFIEFHRSSYRFLRCGNSKHKGICRSSCEAFSGEVRTIKRLFVNVLDRELAQHSFDDLAHLAKGISDF